ncbi:major facilitator superfamily domain-containing protein [Thelonectria olida]|uniref:Major facilitator superfamily domain-containing protein n=1 Tax=Thelonectria olida TaxID=1576542 RepID=A0A9P8WE15_9HYPO|nr:major facilitator superfamily domain-containing protein [Thelonectria olida]
MGNLDIEARPATLVRSDSGDVAKGQVEVGRENLHAALPPHESFEGAHRFDPTASWAPEEERRVVRKTDLRLLTWLCLMFFGLQLDRGNLSNALADNLLDDLGLTTDDYNNGTTIQLLCFLAAEFPVQFLTKRYGFKQVLPVLMVCWGFVSTFQAFMTGRTAFYITRAFIGLFEGGFIPGTILMASYFYTSKELSIRLAAFWSTLNIARVISALLAAGFLEMRGVGGHSGWFWLLLLEGLLTVVLGLLSMAYLPTSPTGTKSLIWRKSWYTEREEVIMINRILRDDPAKGLTALKEPATLADVKAAWTDPSLWGLYFIGLIAYIPATPVQAYLTLTLKRVGKFSTLASNLLTAPSAAIQIVTMLSLAYSSEYFNERSFHCLIGEIWSLPMFVSLLTIPDEGREWGRFSIITLISGYPYFHPIVSSWISENSFDVKKRAIAAATYNVIVQIGSVIGSQIYRKWDAPFYKNGNKVCVSILALAVVTFLVQRQWLIRLNKKKEAEWEQLTPAEKVEYQTDKEAREKDGNKRLDFRYAY